MAAVLKFVRLRTSIKGLVTRAVEVFDRYLDEDPDSYRWVCVDDPQVIARTLEVLAVDLPEDEIARVATQLPYLMLLFHRPERPIYIPVEATLAFLSVLNRADLVTVLRQCSDRRRLAPFFELDPKQWSPVLFLLGGVPDLDAAIAENMLGQCLFFLDKP